MTITEETKRPAVAGVGLGAAKTRTPVEVFAAVGAGFLLVEAYILTKWVVGPEFRSVPSGPSVPPQWMKIVHNVYQPLGVGLVLVFFYWFLVRPWRRERRVTFDGLFCLAAFFASYQDPLSNYFGTWFTYNSYLFNMGSWVGSVPGWGFAAPGQTIAFPLLVVPPAYVYGLLSVMIVGCRCLQRVKDRWPHMGTAGLIGVCYLFALLASVVVEPLFWMPLGLWQYGGGYPAIFGDHYFMYPLNEWVVVSAVLAAITSLRFFRNDKGETLVERGVSSLQASPRKKIVLRALAVTAGMQLIVLCVYNIPQSVVGARAHEWPEDTQKRSYLTNHICGAGTDRACPGTAIPLLRPGSVSVNPEGKLVVPPATKLPEPIPFDD